MWVGAKRDNEEIGRFSLGIVNREWLIGTRITRIFWLLNNISEKRVNFELSSEGFGKIKKNTRVFWTICEIWILKFVSENVYEKVPKMIPKIFGNKKKILRIFLKNFTKIMRTF